MGGSDASAGLVIAGAAGWSGLLGSGLKSVHGQQPTRMLAAALPSQVYGGLRKSRGCVPDMMLYAV